MPRLTRRAASQQLNQRPSINQNILNRSSDGDIDSRRNSQWWKNLSDSYRRNSILRNSPVNPNIKVLNADSTVAEGENSEWWKNLSENCTVSLPNKSNSTDEVPDKKSADSENRILSQSESDNEEVFPKRSLFASQEQRSRKSRYSRAFNLNTEKEIEEEQNVEIEEFKSQLDDDNITESPTLNVIKEKKRIRKTKSIFSRKLRKRKFSDAFKVTDYGPEETEQTNEDKQVQKQVSSTENLSVLKGPSDEKTKEGLFKLSNKNKNYSEAFEDVSNDKSISEKEIVHENNESSKKEINLDEIQTQKDVLYVNLSLNTSKEKNVIKTNEKPSLKEIHNTKTANTSKTNLSLSSSKNEKSVNKVLRNEEDDSKSSDEEIIIEEINTQKEAVETITRSINDLKELKKSSFNRDTKSRKYSKSFLGASCSKIGETKEQENAQYEFNETTPSRQHTKESLFTLQNKNRQFSQAFTNIFEEDANKQNNSAEIVVDEDATKQRKESLENLKNTKYSQAFLELISMQTPVEDTHNVATTNKHNEDNKIVANRSIKETAEKNKSDNDTKFSSISSIDISEEIKHPLFRPKARKSLYTVKSVTKNIDHSKIRSDIEPQQNLEKSKTQRISAKRFSLRSTSPAESISHFFDESLISSTKLFINPNENKDTGSEGSVKNKRGRPVKSVSVVHPDNASEIGIHKSKDNKDAEFKIAIKNKNSTPKTRRTSKSLTILIENPENVPDNQSQMIEENKDIVTNSISKRGRKPKSLTLYPKNLKNVSSNKLTDDSDTKPEELNKSSISERDRKSKSVSRVSKDLENKSKNETINEDTNLEIDELVKNKSVIPKKGKKTQLVTRAAEDYDHLENYEPEYVMKGDNINSKSDELIININSLRKRGRKSKLVTKVSEDPEDNTSEDETLDNENLKAEGIVKNINLASKRGRKSKSVTKVSKDSEDSTSKIETLDEENSKAESIVKNINSASKRGRKPKSITNILKDPEENSSKDETIRDKDSKSDNIVKHENSTSSRKSESGTTVLEDQKNYVPENDIIIRDDEDLESNESMKYKNSTSKRNKKSKSVSKVIEDPENKTTDHNDSVPDDLDKNKNVTPKKDRKSKSVIRAGEDSNKNILKKNSESNKVVKKKKRGRPPKKRPTVSDNVDNIANMDLESEKSVKKSSIRTDENCTNKVKESEELVRNEYSRTRKSSASINENPVEDTLENEILATEEINQEMNNQIKQKTVVSQIEMNLKTVSKVFQKQDNSKTVDDNIMPEEIEDIATDETVKRKILPINNTRKFKSIRYVESHEDEIYDDNVPEKSRQLSVAEPVQSIFTNQRQSSLLSTESISNVITINSSTSRARSSQFSNIKTGNKSKNINIETWLSKSTTNFVEAKQDNKIDNRHTKPSVKRIKTLDDWKGVTASEDSDTSSETKELQKKVLMKFAKKMREEKQNKSPPQVLPKKMTDFFTKLRKDEKLKPIPKKTCNVKKISRLVCTARVINGKPYYSKKLFRGEHWCSPQLYKLLQTKIKNKYGDDTINESENIMKFIAKSVNVVIKSKKHLKEHVDNLKKELAKNGIITTTYDFFCFCLDYLPAEYQDLVVPCTRAYTTEPNVPCNDADVFKPIKL